MKNDDSNTTEALLPSGNGDNTAKCIVSSRQHQYTLTHIHSQTSKHRQTLKLLLRKKRNPETEL